MKDQYQIM